MNNEPSERRRRRRKKLLVLGGIAVVIVAGAVWLVVWDLGRECVRWSNRIEVTKTGGVWHRPVCAEYQPRWSRPED